MCPKYTDAPALCPHGNNIWMHNFQQIFSKCSIYINFYSYELFTLGQHYESPRGNCSTAEGLGLEK